MSNELKPCPFCGKPAKWEKKFLQSGIARCSDYHCIGAFTHLSRSATIIEWNTRPVEDALKAEQEALIHIHQKENAEHDSIIQTLKKQLAASYDQNNAAFLLGMDQMNSLVGEKNYEIKQLKAELEELRYIVEQFKKWSAEGGCPLSHNPDFPCWWEQNRSELEDYCTYEDEAAHGCWVEYYRWKFRRMKKAIGKNV